MEHPKDIVSSAICVMLKSDQAVMKRIGAFNRGDSVVVQGPIFIWYKKIAFRTCRFAN